MNVRRDSDRQAHRMEVRSGFAMDGMHPIARISALGIALLLVAAFVITAAPVSASTGRPTWAAGDYWNYAFGASISGTASTGTLSLNVLGTESVTFNGTAYSSYHVKGTVGFRLGGGMFTYEADVWYSVATLAVVQISAIVNITGLVTITVWGNPPQDIHWPLTTNDAWRSSTAITIRELFASNGTTTYTYSTLSTDFSVLADTSITVPAGTFTCTPLRETETGSSSFVVNYWSSQAGNSVRSESRNSTGGPSGGYNLTSYRYQAGSFFTAVVFGLSTWIWLILAVVILVAIVGVVWIRRRRPPVGAPPQWAPPQQPPMGPPPESPP